MEEVQDNVSNPLGTENIGKLIFKFSIPSIVSLLVNAIYNIVDQIFIGQGIGVIGIAATNVSFPLNIFSSALALLLGVGAASNFNLSLGRKDTKQASFFVGNCLSLTIIVGIVLEILSIVFIKPLLVFSGATEQIIPYALPYTLITALGLPFLIFIIGGCQLIRSDGSPGYSMFCLVFGAVLNALMDPIFLFVLNMGIQGVALSTLISQVLSALLVLYYFLKKLRSVHLRKIHFIVHIKYFKLIFALGMSSFFNNLAMAFVQITLNDTLRYYGSVSQYGSEIPLACIGVISKLNTLFMAFAIGIVQACQPIIGFNYGAQNYDRVKKTYKSAIIIVSFISFIVFFCFQRFPREIINLFGTGNEQYFNFTIKFLKTYMFMTFVNGIQPITASFFASIGKAAIGAIFSLTRQVIFLIPLILILPIYFGIDGIMFAGPISDTVATILAFFLITREFKNIDKLKSSLIST